MQELNVKCVTASNDKVKYGVKLKPEPDFRALGARLGAGLKQVMAACKSLSSEQLAVSYCDISLRVLNTLLVLPVHPFK